MKKLLNTLLIIILSLNSYAISEQEYMHIRDSLQQQVNNAYGKEKVDAMYFLGRHILPYDLEKGDILINEQLKLADSIAYTSGIASAYMNRGFYYYYKNDFPKALDFFLKAKHLYKKEQKLKETGQVDLAIGLLFFFSRQMEKSLDYFQMAAKQFKEANRFQYLTVSYLLIGYYYNTVDINPELSKQIHDKAMKAARKSKLDPLYYSGIFIARAVAYRNSREYDSMFYFIRKSNSFLSGESVNKIHHRSINYKDLGNSYYLIKEYDSAMYYYRLSIREAEKISFIYIISLDNMMMAKIFSKQNNTPRALQYYDQALKYALIINRTGSFYSDPAQKYAPDWLLDNWPGFYKAFSGYSRKSWNKQRLVSIYYQMSALYKKIGQPEKALEYFEQYHIYYDSVVQIKYTNELVNTTLNFKMDESEKQIELLAQENKLKEFQNRQNRILLIILILFIVLIIITGFVLIRQNKLKSEQQNLLLKQRLFRSQINPHFIFNSLASIQNTIINDEPDKAIRYLARFSKLVRRILESSFEDYVLLTDEISMIENYLVLQKLRFSDKFDYSIDVDKNLDTESIQIPLMLAQPFIENSIEHGFRAKRGHGLIRIRIFKKESYLIIEIEDNGIGRKKAGELNQRQNPGHHSLATNITNERIKIINKRGRQKIKLEIIDLYDNHEKSTGTLVRFAIRV